MDDSVKQKLLSLSIFEELRERTEQQKQCWLDGDSCPYGLQEGTFALRPSSLCQVGSCQRITECQEDEFEEFFYGKDGVPVSVEDWLSNHVPRRLSEVLSDVLNGNESGFEFDEDETILFEAVIEILRAADNLNPEIFLAEDIS